MDFGLDLDLTTRRWQADNDLLVLEAILRRMI